MRIHPGLRYVLACGALDAMPATLVSAALGYGLWANWHHELLKPLFGFGTLIMVTVVVLRFATHVWWAARASELVGRQRPVAMLLTAPRGWKGATLALPAARGKALISDARFMTPFSGVPAGDADGLPVRAYLDTTFTDLIVLDVAGQMVCSAVAQRMEQGRTAPDYDEATRAMLDRAIAEAQGGGETVETVQDHLRRLGQESRMKARAVAVIAVVMIGGFAILAPLLSQGKTSGPLAAIFVLLGDRVPPGMEFGIFSALFVGAALFVATMVSRQASMVDRAIEVTRQTPPRRCRVRIRLVVTKRRREEPSRTWYADLAPTDAAGSASPFIIELITNMITDYQENMDDRDGLIYVPAKPGEPVVVQVGSYVAVGKRSWKMR